MAVLGFDVPAWAVAINTNGPEIAAAVMRDLPVVRELVLEADVDVRRVVASCTVAHHDQYGAAYEITEQLASLWSGFADDTVGLRVHVNALQVDVPGQFFTDPGPGVRRRRWAALSSSQLAHRSI